MIDNKKVLALIPARGGSKGIKDKNIVEIEGKPLIVYTIETAVASRYIDKIVVSTDSEKIKMISEKFGAEVPFLRPVRYATDTSTTIEAVLHAVKTLEKEGEIFDILVLLQPTSPLRTKEDLDGALEKFVSNDCKALAAISLAEESPILMRKLIDDNHMEKLLQIDSTIRRQDMPEYYRINGSIYINSITEIDEHTSFNENELPYIIDAAHAVDIDEYRDFELMRYYLHAK